MSLIPLPIRILSYLLALLLLPAVALAQRTVSGRVTAQATREGLPQVTVRVEGQSGGVVTDKDGRFSLPLPAAAAGLTFTHLGYQPLTVPVAEFRSEVSLMEQTYLIGEVQISYVQLQKLLLREWKIAPASLDAATRLTAARVRTTSAERADYLDRHPEAVRRVMELARFDFRPNGVVKTKMLMMSHKLHWQLNEETRTLTVVNDEGAERQIKVVELTDSQLVLLSPDRNAPEITYVPAK